MMPVHTQQPLSQDKISLLQSASRKEVAKALSGLVVTGSADWLPAGNSYASFAQECIKNDGKSVPSHKQSDFAQFLAAASFVHCGDGWSYLGRAIDALIRGDLHATVHLTYYAELRGAISLLASEGIYIGNGANMVLTSGGAVEFVTGEGTHVAVWKYLSAWNDGVRSKNLISRILHPGGVSLDEWVQNLPAGGAGAAISDLLVRMAFDLQSFSNDRVRRNAASYNPTRLGVEDLGTEVAARAISQLWEVLEPDSHGGFPVLDRILIQDVLKASYLPTHHLSDADGEVTSSVDWASWPEWLQQVTPVSVLNTALFDALKTAPRGQGPDSALGKLFQSDQSVTSPRDYVESMLARTTVLLRLATGSCLDLLDESGLGKSSLTPWVESLSVVRGLWDVGEFPDDTLDLWLDVEEARQALDNGPLHSSHALLSSVGSQLVTLGQTERVLAWSFA